MPKTSTEQPIKPNPANLKSSWDLAMTNITYFRSSTDGKSYQFESYIIVLILETWSIAQDAKKQNSTGQINAHAILIKCHTNITKSNVVWIEIISEKNRKIKKKLLTCSKLNIVKLNNSTFPGRSEKITPVFTSATRLKILKTSKIQINKFQLNFVFLFKIFTHWLSCVFQWLWKVKLWSRYFFSYEPLDFFPSDLIPLPY